MRVFVTGSSSHLAAALLPRLCAHPAVERVTGVDLDPPRFQHVRFDASQLDIRDPQLERRLAGHDALVHLACRARRGHGAVQEMFDINVTGGHKVFHAARRAGVRRFIHLSSASVYGSGIHLVESAPLNPAAGNLYAVHQAHLEKLLEIEFPECVRLRPQLVLGPNARPAIKKLLRLPCYVRLPTPYPLLQCVHEDDVAHAVLLAFGREARGAFNLAVEDNFSYRDAVRSRHRLVVPLPPAAARAGLNAARRWLGWDEELEWAEALGRTLLVNCRRVAIELGWRSTHSAASALAQT
jgi:nucleoside-diphosphate-sugar epimerase